MTRSHRQIGASLLGVALVVILASACSKSRVSGSHRVGTVSRGDLLQRVTLAGIIVPQRRTVILPPYAGYVRKMYVSIGEKVQAGQPLVSIVQSLADRGEVFPLRAPFSGTVVQVLHSEGEYVEEKGDQSTLVRIDDLQRLFVMADVPEMDLVKIKPGQDVVIRATAILGKTFKGVIREISIAARERKDWNRSNEKVEFPIRIEITDRDPEIRPGMSSIIDVIAARRDGVLKLQHEYVQRKGDKYQVILESGEERPIEIGIQNEEAFEIQSGLKERDRVRQTDFLALDGEH